MANRKVLPPAAGIGRKKGVPNKATTNAREAIAALVDGNAHRLEAWLDKIALKDPEKAWRCMMDVIEYHIPKLARTEHTGADGGPVKQALEVTFVKPNGS
jgi:hypothetical protein